MMPWSFPTTSLLNRLSSVLKKYLRRTRRGSRERRQVEGGAQARGRCAACRLRQVGLLLPAK